MTVWLKLAKPLERFFEASLRLMLLVAPWTVDAAWPATFWSDEAMFLRDGAGRGGGKGRERGRGGAEGRREGAGFAMDRVSGRGAQESRTERASRGESRGGRREGRG